MHAPATATPTPTVGHDGASFLKAVRAGLEAWVRAAVTQAGEDLSSSAQSHAVAGGREHTSVVLEVLRKDREDLVLRITQALRTRMDMAASNPGPRGAAPVADDELTLTLIDEAQIDEEIETARIVQLIESQADAELQELNALCSSLRRLGQVDPQAAPLRPQVCAQGLRAGLSGLPVEAGTRLLLLRALGSAVGLQMRQVYQAQSRLLSSWGVKPAAFRIKQTASSAGAAHKASADSAAPGGPAAAQSMERLVQWAHATAPAPLAQPGESTEGLMLRLLTDLQPAGRRALALTQPAAQHLMQRLFNQLGAQGEVSPAARELVQGLERSAHQLVTQEPELWSKPDHPWWTLIDRLLAVGAVHDDMGPQGQGALHASLNRVVNRIQEAPLIDLKVCQTAADEVQAVASQLLEGDASELLGQVSDLQRQADREETESELRNQLVQQLRATPVCAALRQFLVGPWAQVMGAQALHHGTDSGELASAALVVDDLIRATSTPGQRVSSAQRTVLLRQLGEGLHLAGLPDARVQAELSDMKALLRDPPEIPEAAETWQEAVDTLPAGHVLDLHAGLPTVPLAMGDDAPAADAGDWLSSLDTGAYCRLFLQGQWLTAQLRWVSPTRNLFLFNSRHGGRSHSLTRRMLQKLRNAGLATRIEDGFLLAQAMDSLVSSTLE